MCSYAQRGTRINLNPRWTRRGRQRKTSEKNEEQSTCSTPGEGRVSKGGAGQQGCHRGGGGGEGTKRGIRMWRGNGGRECSPPLSSPTRSSEEEQRGGGEFCNPDGRQRKSSSSLSRFSFIDTRGFVFRRVDKFVEWDS